MGTNNGEQAMPYSETDLASERIADRAPALTTVLRELRAEWSPQRPPATVTMGALGRALIANVHSIPEEGLIAVARDIEELLECGSEQTKAAIATGFLEAMLDAADSNPESARFLRNLGPLARKHCRGWDAFCGHKTAWVWNEEGRKE